MRVLSDFLFLGIFFVLLAVWFFAWAAMHVASGGIHLLLVLAVVALIAHFMRGRAAV